MWTLAGLGVPPNPADVRMRRARVVRDSRRTRIVLAVLIVASLTLITVDVRGGDDGPMVDLRSFAGSVFGQFSRQRRFVVSPVQDLVERVSEGDQERLDRLERENAELRTRLRTTELARARAQELDDLLRVAGIGQYTIVPAQVIAVGAAQDFAWAVTIDAGSRDEVSTDMTVLNGDGLVGRVKTASLTTSTVLLAIDPTSSVGARLEATLELGIATGRGDEPMLELQCWTADPLAEGDRIVTFGSAGRPVRAWRANRDRAGGELHPGLAGQGRGGRTVRGLLRPRPGRCRGPAAAQRPAGRDPAAAPGTAG